MRSSNYTNAGLSILPCAALPGASADTREYLLDAEKDGQALTLAPRLLTWRNAKTLARNGLASFYFVDRIARIPSNRLHITRRKHHVDGTRVTTSLRPGSWLAKAQAHDPHLPAMCVGAGKAELAEPQAITPECATLRTGGPEAADEASEQGVRGGGGGTLDRGHHRQGNTVGNSRQGTCKIIGDDVRFCLTVGRGRRRV